VDYNWVTPRVATGGAIYSPDDVDRLIADGVTHIATMAIELEDETAEFIDGRLPHLRNGTDDDGKWKDAEWFKTTLDFARDALADPKARVYIHCGAGINRGPSGAYAVMREQGFGAREAYDRITNVRTVARYNGVIYAACADVAVAALGIAPLDRYWMDDSSLVERRRRA
jgi:hypothetical protein